MTLKELREREKISQRQLAKKVGVTANAVNQYERGKRTPNIVMVSRLAAALNVSIETIVVCFTDEKAEKAVE